MYKKLSASKNVSLALAIVIISFLWKQTNGFFLEPDLPCDFLDAINITDGVRLENGIILHDGVQYPKDQYAEVNYILENGGTRVPVKSYMRGCLCNIKKCIRLCCPYGQFVDLSIQVGKKCRPDDAAKNFESEIEGNNQELSTVKLHDHFGYVDDRPCEQFYNAYDYQILHVCIDTILKSEKMLYLFAQYNGDL